MSTPLNSPDRIQFDIESPLPLPKEESLIAVPKEFLDTNPRIKSLAQYQEMHHESIHSPSEFWGREASDLEWFVPWNNIHSENRHDWFQGAETNLCYNALDRHVQNGLGDKVAINFKNDHISVKHTYRDLLDLVSKLANCLETQFGITKGDRILIYMPLCPENVIAMLACVRIGAIHTVVFGGFSAAQIRTRINECTPKLVITADVSYRRGSFIRLKDIVDTAIRRLDSVKTIVLQRETSKCLMEGGRDFDWLESIKDMPSVHQCVSVESSHPSFILYTSGSTGKPKGIVHSTGGYMVGAYTTCKYVFDMKPEDTYWCTADLGWITGHTYVAYGPLLMGVTQVMYEGTFNYPAWDQFFKIIEEMKVSILYTAPTLLRSLMEHDQNPNDFDLSSLRLLGSVGEPINVATWKWFFKSVGGSRCPVVDTWWQTETGSNCLTPLPGVTVMKPGSCATPFFGIWPVVLDENGEETSVCGKGSLYLKYGWPSMMNGMWGQSEEVFRTKYFTSSGMYNTSDAAMKDENGYVVILGRSDDQLNVSGHRIGTAELESAVMRCDVIAKAAVVALDDDITGQSIAVVAVLRDECTPSNGTGKRRAIQFAQDNIKHAVTNWIGPHARPKYIFIVENLPETKSGKTMRGLVKEVVTMAMKKNDADLETDQALAALGEKFSTMDRDAGDSNFLIQDLYSLVKEQTV